MTTFAPTTTFAPSGSPAAAEPGGPDATDGASIAGLTPTYVRQQWMKGRGKLSWARAQRKRAAELCAGQHYGNDPTDQTDKEARASERRKRQPVNLGMQQLRTLLWYLTYSAGDPEITSKFSDDEMHALILNKLAEEDFQAVKMVDTYQRCLIDCFLGGLGIGKTGIKAGSKVFSDGRMDLDPGDFYGTHVSLDDFGCDPMARHLNECRFGGYINRVSRAETLRANLYGRDVEERDPQIADNPYLATREEAAEILTNVQHRTSAGSDGADSVAGMTSSGGEAGSDTDHIELIELEWRIDGRMYSIVLPANPATGEADASSDRFLLIEPCADEKRGSLRYIWIIPSIDNLMPLALEAMQRDLCIVADALARKITRAAIEAKKGAIYAAGEEDTALQVKKAPDNFLIKGDPSKWTPLEIAGMVQESIPAMDFVMTHWNNNTNQMQLASGAGENTSDSGTATEYNGNLAKVQGWIQYLEQRLEEFAGDFLQDWAGFKLADPTLSQTIAMPLGQGLTMPLTVDSAMLHDGGQDFALMPGMAPRRTTQFYYRIRSTSMRPMDPVMEGNQIIQFIAQGLQPMVAGIQMGVLKPGALRVVLRKLGVQEADEIVNDMEMLAQQQQMQMAGPPPMWGGQEGQQGGAPGAGGMMPPGMAAMGGAGGAGPGAGMPQTPMAMQRSVKQSGKPKPSRAA